MDAKLVVISGSTKTSEYTLRLPAVLGRGRDATLMLPHPLVSRRHCEIFESNGYLVVRDMGSLNGTFVDNKRVTEAVLPPGATLTLGSVTFQAVYGSSPAVAMPAAMAPAAPVPSRPSPPKGDADQEDFGDFEMVEEPVPKRAAGTKKPPKRSASPSPAEPVRRSEAGPAKPDAEDLGDFLADFE